MFDYAIKKVSRRLAVYDRSRAIAMQNSRPLVSFTFDDIPASAAENGRAALERFGVRGTFYVSAGLAGTVAWNMTMASLDAVADLHSGGHEIGCHSFSHRPIETLETDETRCDLEQNRNALTTLGVIPTSFAYPFGIFSYPHKRQVAPLFSTCRSVMPGIHVGTLDPGLLRAVALYRDLISMQEIDALLVRTARRNGWLIFFTHDVSTRPSEMGCSPEFLAEVIERAQDKGCACLPVADAFRSLSSETVNSDTGRA